MDHFGIGQALKGMVLCYFNASRRTGRTTSLIESLKDGDRVCCLTSREAGRLQRLCRERDLKVEFIVIDPSNPGRIFEHGTSQGRTLFDHTWIEQYYMNALQGCAAEINRLQTETSGFGAPHIETRRKALEMAKWRP